jgi:hypothetical protein
VVLVGFSSRQVIDDFGSDKLNLNIGAGLKTVREDMIDLDFSPFTNVDLVADASFWSLKVPQ